MKISRGQYESPMTFVRGCKGAPISVLVALSFIGRPATSIELQTWTGYKDDNITLATRQLIEMGWLVAIGPRGPWGLAEGKQLPLMEWLDGDSDLIGLPSPTTTTEISFIAENGRSSNKTASATPKISDSTIIRLNPKFDENIAACRAMGIGAPTREILSDLEHVTPELIKAHVKGLTQGETIGLAIVRIRENEAPREIIDEAPREAKRYSDNIWSEYLSRRTEDEIQITTCVFPILDPARAGEVNKTNGLPYIKGRCGATVVPGSHFCKIHQTEE